MPTHRLIYLSAPFDSQTAELRDALNIASAEADFRLARSEQLLESGQPIADSIRHAIERSALVIGDATGGNPHVMWELGIAQALGKPILILAQDPGSVPFDLQSAPVLTYHPSTPFVALTERILDGIYRALGPGVAAPSSAIHRGWVFFSYSHSDASYLDRMLIHLRPVERSGAIDLWSDTKLKPGDRWRDEIRRAIGGARIAVLLISADFLASEFITTDELPPLLAKAEVEGARIVPVILKPSRFLRDERLARFHALNDPKAPVLSMGEPEREELYAKLAELIEAETAFR